MTSAEENEINLIHKQRNLILGIILDLIGMLSFTVPGIGEFTDVIWAPIAGFALSKMYKGTVGKVGGVLEFVEQILPFDDFIPTFTLVWIYTYVIKNKNQNSKINTKELV